MRITSLSTRRKAVAALSVAAVAGFAGIATAPMASAAAAPITLSVVSGPSGGGNALTATTLVNTFNTGLNVSFQYKSTASTVCTPFYTAPVAVSTGAGNVAVTSPKILSAKKLAFSVPSTVALTPPAAVGATSASWLVCVYPGTSTTASAVTASAAYTVAAAPTLTAISPASGPALGGGTVTLTGTNFVTGTTAKIGSQPLTGVVVAANGLTLTGTVPPQAAGAAQAISVTNVGGTTPLAAAYTYFAGIVASPNTAPTNTAVTDVDIQGVGFSSLTFAGTTGSTIDSATAHVYLVDGDYDPTDSTGAKTKGELGECLNVLVISDNELICTVNTADSDGAGTAGAVIVNGTYTLTVVGDGGVDVQTGGAAVSATYSKTIVSSGSTFTVAPF